MKQGFPYSVVVAYTEPPEMFLSPGDVPRGHDQGTLGRLVSHSINLLENICVPR